jgi:hypothetical protein
MAKMASACLASMGWTEGLGGTNWGTETVRGVDFCLLPDQCG